MPNPTDDSVKAGEITYTCWDCAAKFRTNPPYDGTYNQHTGTCEICKEEKAVTSAKKAFGYHRFI